MFNSYEELMETVNQRRDDVLSLEVDMNTTFSQEHEDAKSALQKAQALQTITGDQPFLSNNLERLEAEVERTRPPAKPIWIKYKRLPLLEWAALMKSQGMSAIDQYEKVLNKTFIGVFNTPDAPTPLSDDPRLLSSAGDLGILPGGTLHAVVQSFMSWQNAGGNISIHPTKSGQD